MHQQNFETVNRDDQSNNSETHLHLTQIMVFPHEETSDVPRIIDCFPQPYRIPGGCWST